MKKILAVVIAVLVMVTLLPAAVAKGKTDKPDNTAKQAALAQQKTAKQDSQAKGNKNKPDDAAKIAKKAAMAEQKAAKQTFMAALKIKKQTMQTNHHELMKLRIEVRTALEQINETLMVVLQNGSISPELSALLPQAQIDIQTILDGLKATGNNGEIRRQVNACLEYAKQQDYTKAAEEIDKLIAKQLEQKAALEQLVTKAQTLLSSIVAAANTVPVPSPTPTVTIIPTPSVEITPTPSIEVAPTPSA